MGCKRTGLLLASVASFIPLSFAATPHTTIPTQKTPPPIDDAPSLREFAVQELEKASLESSVPLQDEFALEAPTVTSARSIGALILSFIGWMSNASIEPVFHPVEFAKNIWRTFKFFPFLYSLGILNDLATMLYLMCIHRHSVEQTATNQARLATRRWADCAIQEPFSEEMKHKLLADSKRYFSFSTAAYGLPQVWASKVQQHSATECAMGIGDGIHEKVVEKIASYLGISSNQILFMTPLGGPLSNSHHFVAVDDYTGSVVLAIRGTYSVSELCADAKAFTGT